MLIALQMHRSKSTIAIFLVVNDTSSEPTSAPDTKSATPPRARTCRERMHFSTVNEVPRTCLARHHHDPGMPSWTCRPSTRAMLFSQRRIPMRQPLAQPTCSAYQVYHRPGLPGMMPRPHVPRTARILSSSSRRRVGYTVHPQASSVVDSIMHL